MKKSAQSCAAVSECTPTQVDFGSQKDADYVFSNFNLESFGMLFKIFFYLHYLLFNVLFKQVKIFSICLNKAVMQQIALDFVIAK